ncbi:MAG: ABC transporter ATP-binding protein [Pseudomonadota bacterium]
MRDDFGYAEEASLGRSYDARLLARLYPFARPYRLRFLVSILLVMAITLLELALPYATKIAVDRYIVPPAAADGARWVRADLSDSASAAVVATHPSAFTIEDGIARTPYSTLQSLPISQRKTLRRTDLDGLGVIALAMLALIALDFVVNFVQAIVMEITGQRIMHDIRMTLFRHMQRLPLTFFSHQPVGRLVTRVTNDIENMHELFTSVVSVVFKDIFLLAGIAVVLMGLNWRLSLICFTVLPAVVVASAHFANRSRNAFRNLRIKLAEINTRFSETLSGIRVIHLFGAQAPNHRAFSTLNHAYFTEGMLQVHLFAVFLPFIEVLGACALAIVIYWGGKGIVADTVSVGDLVVFISYMKMFFRPIRDIAEKYNIMQNAMASAERIFLLLREETPEDAAAPAGALRPPANAVAGIAFEKVDFSYSPGQPVLKAIDLHIAPGESIAVVGPTGSGKTTLTQLLLRFYAPTSGRITIDGTDIAGMDLPTLRGRFALVMQDPFLFSDTVRANVFPDPSAAADPARVAQVIDAAHCRHLIERLPEGIDTVLSAGGGNLSSGERQLIAIARAIARDPDIIILDEATSYVDSETERYLQGAMKQLMAGRTAIIVAHRLSTARQADRIVVLHQGRLVESGTHDALMRRRGMYYRLQLMEQRHSELPQVS